MKKSVIWNLVFCLLLSSGIQSKVYAEGDSAINTEEQTSLSSPLIDTASEDSTVYTDVYTPQALPQKTLGEDDVATQENVQNDVYANSIYQQLEDFKIDTPYGMDYYNKFIFVAQGKNGISRISLTTGKIHVIVGKSANIDFRAVTLDKYGNLYYTVRSSLQVYKFIFDSSVPLPLSAEQFRNQSIAYTDPAAYGYDSRDIQISSIGFSHDNQLYVSLFRPDYVYSGLRPQGLLKWNPSQSHFDPIINDQVWSIKSIDFDSQGNLHLQLPGDYNEPPYELDQLSKISRSQLNNWPIEKEDIPQRYFHSPRKIYGLAVLPNGRIYASDSTSIFAPFPSSKPILTLNGQKSIKLLQGQPYNESGASIEDEKYNNIPLTITYTLDGKPVDHLDTSVIGTYQIDYNAVNPDGYAAVTQTRTVVITLLPADLSDIYLIAPGSMDADATHLYITDKYNQPGETGGIYKVSLSNYQKSLLVQTDQTFSALAVDEKENLYFALPHDSRIGKVNIRDLDSSVPLTSNQFFERAEYVQPFANQPKWQNHTITGLDFDQHGKLYITLQLKGGYDGYSILTRTAAADFLVTGPAVNIPYDIKDISFGPSGNLLILGARPDNYNYRITASQLLHFSSNILPEKMVGSYTEYAIVGLAILSTGEVYVSNSSTDSTYFPTLLQKMPFSEPALPNPAPVPPPVITIDRNEVSQFKDDLYYERGFTVQDATYAESELTKSITYSFHGKTIPAIDIHTAGVYVVHYNAMNPAGVSAIEKIRIVTVRSAPYDLFEWDIDAIKGLGANSKDVYVTSAFNEQNPNYGLLKISLATMKKTKLADLPSGQAITAKENGDLFFSRYGFDNMFYKTPASQFTEGKVLSYSELMHGSQTFQPFKDNDVKGNTVEITGLDWDAANRYLYVAGSFTNKKTHKTTSKVVRFKDNDMRTYTPIATFNKGTHDIEISRNGNLYVILDGFKLYKVTAKQLNNRPLTISDFTNIDNPWGDEAIVFLQDGYGYVSSMSSRNKSGSSFDVLLWSID
ncbi:immunoglobulin-like domain-containing protein [Paenibacillus sp. WLX2291]|uniref:immunoglobulin-like domain-containing protein n=1 Tax=Paenibacillus sp. WLX2291 TaxID=3296934 RepID=UPI0039842044